MPLLKTYNLKQDEILEESGVKHYVIKKQVHSEGSDHPKVKLRNFKCVTRTDNYSLISLSVSRERLVGNSGFFVYD